ncbi:MAG: type II secretion system protein GspL [Myxococcota bacterium]|nr:type II secretion system protein GspL [Myxococcota bacterium]
MARRILGLDVGSHAIKAVELRQTLRGLEVAQLRSLRLDGSTPSSAEELREFLRLHDLGTEHVVASLPGDRASVRRLRFPFKDRRKIGPAVPFEVEAQVPYELDDFVLDWQVVAEGAQSAEVAVALAPRSEVALLLETLDEAGAPPRVVEAEGLVLGHLAEVFQLPGTRLLADLGHRKTTLCLLEDGRPVAARTLPLGGLALTRALARERGLDEDEAERCKHEQDLLGAGGSRAAAEVVDRLAREIVRTVGSLEATPGAEGRRVERVDLLGGTAHLRGLDATLSRRLGLPAARLPLPSGDLGPDLLAGGDPALFAPAIALALRGSARARTRMNLRKDDLAPRLDLGRVRRELRVTGWLAAAAAILWMGSVGARWVVEQRRADVLEQRAEVLYREAFPDRRVPSNVTRAMQEAVEGVRRRADTLGVYGGSLSALDVLTEISARVPRDIDVVFEELAIDGQIVQIKGHSPSFGTVDRLRRELARDDTFSRITVGDITSDTRRGGQNFSLRIHLGGAGEETS